jgi:hypothetical protein
MKTLVKIGLGIIIVAVTIFYAAPALLYRTALGQQLFLWVEGDQVATFYFKEEDKTSNIVYMKGIIYANTLADLKALLLKQPNIKTIVMEHVGGSIDDEVNLLASREIRKHGIATHIPADGMVASGGTDMFLAGSKRTIEAGAKLGVHSWADEEKTARQYSKTDQVHDLYLQYYREMKIPESFYWYTLDVAPANDILWMSASDIVKYQVVTQAY